MASTKKLERKDSLPQRAPFPRELSQRTGLPLSDVIFKGLSTAQDDSTQMMITNHTSQIIYYQIKSNFSEFFLIEPDGMGILRPKSNSAIKLTFKANAARIDKKYMLALKTCYASRSQALKDSHDFWNLVDSGNQEGVNRNEISSTILQVGFAAPDADEETIVIILDTVPDGTKDTMIIGPWPSDLYAFFQSQRKEHQMAIIYIVLIVYLCGLISGYILGGRDRDRK